MKKSKFIPLMGLLLALGMVLTGCSGSSGTDSGAPAAAATEPAATPAAAETTEAAPEATEAAPEATEAAPEATEAGSEAGEQEAGLIVRFGHSGAPFVMYLEDNETAAAIAGYVGTASWNLPIYSYDESDVMEYYDIPRRYEIPDHSEHVTQAHAGDVFYSDPNRIVLYYADAEIDEEYTRIGRFDATPEFIDAVVNNPVLEGWGNQIVVISAGE